MLSLRKSCISSGVQCQQRCRRNAVVCRAAAAPVEKKSLVRSIAAAVEVNGAVQRYEMFAGRSAMVGVAAAVLIELVTDQGVFSSTGNAISNETAMAYAVTAACTLGIAGAAALARSSVQSGVEVLESVYASLTAVKRSAASVTQTQVDKAVDYLLETVLEGRLAGFSVDALLSDDEHY